MTDTTSAPVRVDLRRLEPEADIPALTRIANAALAADRIQERFTEQQIGAELTAEEKFDPVADFRVAEVDGATVAFCKVEWIDTNDGLREYRSWCEVDPAWRRRRIGTQLLGWARTRIDELSASQDVDRPRVAGCWAAAADLGADRLYRTEGYEPARWFFHMNRDLSQPIHVSPMPEGLEVRPVTADDARRLFLADNEAFRDHWGGIDSSDAAFQRWISEDDWDPALWVVAFEGDEIAGASINAIYRKANADMGVLHGWLDSVFTRRPWRRRGLARALVARSLVLLKEQGMAEGILGVDADNENGALGVYTDNGFVVTERFTAYRRTLEVSR
jgi:GNAT superfamily N-acetyltransferase